MPAPAAFATACRDAARDLRRLPADIRRALAREVKPVVADPLAARIRAGYFGPYARALAASTKTRVAADPRIVIGGARKVVSGGASGRQIVFGDQFGGGKKSRVVTRKTRHSGTVRYRRRTTRQFTSPRPSVFKTIDRSMDWVIDQYATIVEKVITRGR